MICHNLRQPNVGDDKTWHVISKGSFISILQKSRYIREKKKGNMKNDKSSILM